MLYTKHHGNLWQSRNFIEISCEAVFFWVVVFAPEPVCEAAAALSSELFAAVVEAGVPGVVCSTIASIVLAGASERRWRSRHV